MSKLEEYFLSLNDVERQAEKKALEQLTARVALSDLDIEVLLYYTIHHGCPPYAVRINLPLTFLAKNIDYVKAVYNIYRKSLRSKGAKL